MLFLTHALQNWLTFNRLSGQARQWHGVKLKNKTPKIKIKLKRSQKLTKLGQIIYLTCSNFQGNNLWESASSCSFGFIFSFVPLALIILTVLVGILRVSPGILEYVNAFAGELYIRFTRSGSGLFTPGIRILGKCTAFLAVISLVYGTFQYFIPGKPEKHINTVIVQQNMDPWNASESD